ncbi:MAG: DUF6356 family protein [Novosphingobium sp.]
MLRRLFTDHPRSVDETYVRHFSVASRFGAVMLRGGFGALVHAVFPGLCVTTGSRALAELNALRDAQRAGKSAGND